MMIIEHYYLVHRYLDDTEIWIFCKCYVRMRSRISPVSVVVTLEQHLKFEVEEASFVACA